MAALLRELRHAARRLARRRAVTALAVATMALAIGSTNAIFSVVHAVLLRPLPVADEDRLAMLWEKARARGFDHVPILYPEFLHWRNESRSFEGLAAIAKGNRSLTLVADGDPTLIEVAPVSSAFFDVVGVRSARGRAFTPGDAKPGEIRASVLTHAAWLRRFGADPEVVGRILRIDGKPHQVVGIAPPKLDYPPGVELWTCLGEGTGAELDVLGRLKPGITLARARAEVDAIARRWAARGPPGLRDNEVVAVPLRETLVGKVRAPLLILLGAVGFVLAIAAANVANLLLIEIAARRHLLAVLAALGASRGHLARQLLIESGLLAGSGGLLGTLLAAAGVRFLLLQGPAHLPRLDGVGGTGISLHPTVMGFSLLVTVLAAGGCGLAPALRAAHLDPAGTLRVRSPGGGQPPVMKFLVVAEISLALMLLIGAGLLFRSFLHHRGLDRGFRAENLLAVRLHPPSQDRGLEPMLALYDELLPRLEALPGVVAASPVFNRPLATHDGYDAVFTVEGKSVEDAMANPYANLEAVTPGYLETLGITLERGRFFGPQDRADSEPVAVINRALAERFWPRSDPLGKRLKLGTGDGAVGLWLTVVGVVGDLRYRDLTAVRPDLYLPLAQSFLPPYRLVVRTDDDPANVVAAVRHEIGQLLPQAAVDVHPFETLLAAALAPPRFHTGLATVFAVFALGLAAVGIYGVIASLIGAREHEIAVRMALGAGRRQVLALVLRQGAALALSGVALGLAAAAVLTRVIECLLFEVSPFDPPTFAVLAVVVLGVALIATLVPARRAARLEPLRVLRVE